MATKPALVPHQFTDESITFILSLPDVYAQDGSTIAGALGLTRLNPTSFEPDDNDVGLTVSEGMKTGRLLKLRISYRDTSVTPNRTKSSKIICPTSKVDTAISALKGKSYKGFNITGAGVPRRRRLT